MGGARKRLLVLDGNVYDGRLPAESSGGGVKRTLLKRTSSLSRRRKPANPAEDLAAKAAWKEPHGGFCRCGCFPPTLAMFLERHHIVDASVIKQLGRHDLLWDLRNALDVCPKHHARHTSAFRRIPLSVISADAVGFAAELMGGEGPAMVWLDRHYAGREQAA